MSSIVYRIFTLLAPLLRGVPVGTNLGLFWLLFALLSGRFLESRGAVFAALSALGLVPQAVRRSAAALNYGQWHIGTLLDVWHQQVHQEGRFCAHRYAGFCPVACDLVGFFRPQLRGCFGKHYQSQADKVLPAVVLAIVGEVGSVGRQRLALPRLLVRQQPTDKNEADLQGRVLRQAGALLAHDQTLVTDAGFGLGQLLSCGVPRFVVRLPKNFTARRNVRPAYTGKGRPPVYGQRVRPLPRKRAGKLLVATQPDDSARWKSGDDTVRADIWNDLVLSDAKPGSPAFRCAAIHHPRYKEPLVLATNLPITAFALFCLYRDRWPIEQLPLAAKQMLGAERAFVFGKESRFRLPELAVLAGHILSYVAATSQPVASGFWDRCCRPTCGRLRRSLARWDFSELPIPSGQLRKKNSVTAHLPKGVRAHRRSKTITHLQGWPTAA
jgi:hypothetical protein